MSSSHPEELIVRMMLNHESCMSVTWMSSSHQSSHNSHKKAIDIKNAIDRDPKLTSMASEVTILATLALKQHHPFISNLHCGMVEKDVMYLVMDLSNAGKLRYKCFLSSALSLLLYLFPLLQLVCCVLAKA